MMVTLPGKLIIDLVHFTITVLRRMEYLLIRTPIWQQQFGGSNILTAVYTPTNPADLSQGGQLVITANTNNVDDQPVLTASESDTNGEIVNNPTNQTQNGAVIDDSTAVEQLTYRQPDQVWLDVLNITTAGLMVQQMSLLEIKAVIMKLGILLKYSVQMAGDDGANDFTTVAPDTATTQVKTFNYGMPNTTRLASGTYNNVQIQVATCS